MTMAGTAAAGALDGLDQLALVVRLEVLDGQAAALGLAGGGGHVVVEGVGAVDLGLPVAQQVQVRPREEQDDGPLDHVGSVRQAGTVDDEDPGLPIGLTPASNGEFRPLPATPLVREVVRRSRLALDANARRTGLSRRDFLLSAAGSATMLAVLAACSKESGDGNGGTFTVPPESTVEPGAAEEALGGDEFVFDVQSHFLDYPPDSTQPLPSFPQSSCGDGYDCYSVETWLDLMFAQSDTSVAVLSAVPFPGDLLSSEVMAEAIGLADRLCGQGRVLMQGHATPSAVGVDALPDAMAEVADRFPIRAWKAYTHAGGPGWYLDDPLGDVFLSQAVALGLPTVAVHKGFGRSSEFSSPVDVGPAAVAHPDVDLVIYHSGFDGWTEGPYDPEGQGVDRLVRSLDEAGVGPGATCTPSWARRGARSWARPTRPPTCSARCSWPWARTTCAGAPTRSGTARPRTSSRPSGPSRSPRSSRSASATPP